MGKKFLFLEVQDLPGKSPIVYIWTHHGEGLQGEWRGAILQPRRRILRWLQALINRYYDKHQRAYTRARTRAKKHPFKRSIHDMYLLHIEGKDEQSTDDE